MAEDPHPLDNSRPLPEGEVGIGVLAEPVALVEGGGENAEGGRSDRVANRAAVPALSTRHPEFPARRDPQFRRAAQAHVERDVALVAWLAALPDDDGLPDEAGALPKIEKTDAGESAPSRGTQSSDTALDRAFDALALCKRW